MPENEFPKLRPHPAKEHAWSRALPPARHAGVRGEKGASLREDGVRDSAASSTSTSPPDDSAAPSPPANAPPFAELLSISNYSFLRGASHPEELVRRAAALGYRALGLADWHSLAGMVRAHVEARAAGVRLVVGARIALEDMPGVALALFPTALSSYKSLCRLLTLGKGRAPKGQCLLRADDLRAHAPGMQGVLIPAGEEGVLDEPGPGAPRAAAPATTAHDAALAAARALRPLFDSDSLSLAAALPFTGDRARALDALVSLSRSSTLPLLATTDALYHDPARRPLQDVLTCIREKCTIASAGLVLSPNAERHLKEPAEMHRLFARVPEALERGVQLASRCDFSLDELKYEYPAEVVPPGRTPMQHLRDLTYRGAHERYPAGLPDTVRAQIEHELALIDELNYAHYFLTVEELVAFSRSRGILCQGRGAAANSAVCYCLGVTAVDPTRVQVLFERFISRERNEPPDIDIDFEHERREEAIQHLYEKYGRERAALTAEVISYRSRSAVRDVGKALGLSLDLVDRLAKSRDWWDKGGIDAKAMRALGLNPADPTLRWLARLADEILGFPRHLSQHVGGFVLTQTPLCEIVPIEPAAMPGRTVIEWDKDDIDALHIMKVDVLGLGMLTAVRKCLHLLRDRGVRTEDTPAEDAPAGGSRTGGSRTGGSRTGGARELTLATIPPECPATYDMICAANTVGVFQIESRAQMSMLPRLRPRCWYDLVIEVAIVRPGPIQGDMVHPYLRRRNGEEPVEYATPEVRRVLGRTLGVPLFQEQCMALAVACAGFTPGEADALRRAMAAWKRKGDLIYRFGQKIVEGMTANGYDRRFAERVFEQIKGFSEYGFPESHAASFALIVYASCWLKRHHPAAFACALLNSQPMGFYAPAQLVRDARAHGVEVRPVDVHASAWDCTLEDDGAPGAGRTTASSPGTSPALRLGLRMVRGLSREEGERLVDVVRRRGPFQSVERLRRAARVRAVTLKRLAEADAFNSMGLPRQRALWAVRALRDEPMPLFDHLEWDRDDQPAAINAAAPPPDAHTDALAHALAAPAAAPALERDGGADLPPVRDLTTVVHDYASVGLSLRKHPVAFVRDHLAAQGVTPCGDLRDAGRCPDGAPVRVAGLVLVRQRPGTASGIVFITLEDESGIANLVVPPRVFERDRHAARHCGLLLAHGRVERRSDVVHVKVSRLRGFAGGLDALEQRSRDFH